MKETLRLHPFVLPFRTCNADTTVQGRPVPAGTMVQAAIGVMQRDPVHFPSPDSFRPHRFIDGLSPEAALRYQPFGMGPRGCLGCAPSRHDPTCMRHMHVQQFFLLCTDAPLATPATAWKAVCPYTTALSSPAGTVSPCRHRPASVPDAGQHHRVCCI